MSGVQGRGSKAHDTTELRVTNTHEDVGTSESEPRLRDMPRVDRIVVCVFVGLLMAAGLSIYSTVVYVAKGSAEFRETWGSLWQVIGLYFTASLLGSVLAGWLMPMLRSKLGALLFGTIVAMPVYGLGMVALEGTQNLNVAHLVLLVLLSALVGGGAAILNR